MTREAPAAEAREEPAAEGGAIWRRLGLRARVFLLMAIGVFFPLALMAGVGWYWLHGLDERLLAARVAAAAAVAAHFDEALTGDLELLQRLASGVGPHFAELDPEAADRAARETFAHFRHREAVFLLDAGRRIVAEEPRGRLSATPATALPLVGEVLRSGLPRLSDLVLDRRGALVHELVPVRDWSGAVVGVAGGTFDPARRDFDRMLRLLRRGQSGVADLVDSGGAVVASTDPRRIGAPVECRAWIAGLLRDHRSESARCDGCHAERGVPVRRPELRTVSPLASSPWGVVLRQSTEEALPSEGAVPWIALLLVLAVQTALAGLFAWGAVRSVTQPVAVLTAEAERIASGDLAWPIPPLGADEVGHLGRSLDRMRQAIKDLVERVGRANEELERRVADRTRELNDANARLREREADRVELLRKVITAQEEERRRVARELHDETSQELAVLLMRIDRADVAIRAGGAPALDELRAVATRALDDVHRLILDLRPSVLDDLGLLSAIRWYADRTLTARGIAVRCEFGELGRLPPELETALFRLCQEAMSNVARHAQATQVLVEVAVSGREIAVDVEDDGRGFDPEAVARREGRRPWGLLGIRERAELLGGAARIESSPGNGTRVSVRIPLPVEDPP